jgi:hypothetical protein
MDAIVNREKLTRIWSQHRGRFVVVRIRYDSVLEGSRHIFRLSCVEELD